MVIVTLVIVICLLFLITLKLCICFFKFACVTGLVVIYTEMNIKKGKKG